MGTALMRSGMGLSVGGILGASSSSPYSVGLQLADVDSCGSEARGGSGIDQQTEAGHTAGCLLGFMLRSQQMNIASRQGTLSVLSQG